jgi:hypothetical protein
MSKEDYRANAAECLRLAIFLRKAKRRSQAKPEDDGAAN